jgi:hypothetical protein
LKNYTIPFVQLDTEKSILVFSHNHNSFDKTELLKQMPNPCIHETSLTPRDLVKETDILTFFMDKINGLLDNYEPGKLDYKPDVKLQLEQMKQTRDNKIKDFMNKQAEYQETLGKFSLLNFPKEAQDKINQQNMMLQQLLVENKQLKEKIVYLDGKIKTFIVQKIEERKTEVNTKGDCQL